MINIAICDDDYQERKLLLDGITQYFHDINERCVLEMHESGKTLLDAAKKTSYDLLLLDVMLGDENGINVAEKIRLSNSKVGIVFVSSSREFACDGYAVNALAYLIKPLDTKQLKVVLDKFLVHFRKAWKDCLTVYCDGVNVRIPLDRILYIESRNKKISFHTMSDTSVDTYAKLDDYALILQGYPNFLRCHKSYLINMDHVVQLKDNKFLMKNNVLIPVPKDSVAPKKKLYYDYLMSK